MIKAGFARVDITPPLGTSVAGYYRRRIADGILDPLLATAVVFDDGEKRSALIQLDLIGFNQVNMDRLRKGVADRIGTVPEAVFAHCSHTHLGPIINPGRDGKAENLEYVEWLLTRVADVAQLAVCDLAPAKMLYTRGEVKDVAFIRRFLMKDGTTRTNPGLQNPDIDSPLGAPDENSSLVILKRENKPEIGIVNFQVHPDVISGEKFSADFPKFVRDTYEKMIDNSLCVYINGAQGDTNHIDVRLSENDLWRGYDRARYMGQKIAMSVIANYPLAEELPDGKIAFAQENIMVDYNKGRPDQIDEAVRVAKIYYEKGAEAAAPQFEKGMQRTTYLAEATRIASLIDKPDQKELYITAMSVGDVVFAGFPGEPFTDMGRYVKNNSEFTLTITACCANGYEGYYPMQSAFDEGGYEARSSRYKAGTAEKIMHTSAKLVNSLK